MMDEQMLTDLQERVTYRRTLNAELDGCLADIRSLQKVRVRLEGQIRQAQREAQEIRQRAAEEAAAKARAA